MNIKTFTDAVKALDNNQFKPTEYYLIFNRIMWESELFSINGYSFSKEELDAAEKLDVKLIGTKNGVKCYLPNFKVKL